MATSQSRNGELPWFTTDPRQYRVVGPFVNLASIAINTVQRRAIRLIGDPALTYHFQPISHRRGAACCRANVKNPEFRKADMDDKASAIWKFAFYTVGRCGIVIPSSTMFKKIYSYHTEVIVTDTLRSEIQIVRHVTEEMLRFL
nr:unnamed protein product [Callosobruchus chinensis]